MSYNISHLTKKKMAYKGKQITNPVSRQTITFVTTAKESKGDQLEMVSTWEPTSFQPSPHYHPYQDEVFEVMDGELTLLLNGKTWTLKKGESIDIPASAVHSMWNASKTNVVARWKVFPALNTEYLLETGMGLAADGKTTKDGVPDLLQVALLAKKFKKEFRLKKPPFVVQQIIFGMLAPLARLKGKKAIYPKYID